MATRLAPISIFLLFVGLLLSVSIWGQETDPDPVGTPELLERFRSLVGQTQATESKLTDLIALERERSDRLQKKEEELRALPTREPPVLGSDERRPEPLQAHLEAIEQITTTERQRLGLATELQGLWETHLREWGPLLDQARLLEQELARLERVLNELRERARKGELPVDAPPLNGSLDPATRRKELAARAEAWQRLQAGGPTELERLRLAAREAAERLTKLEGERQATLLRLTQARSRQSVLEEHRGTDPGTLRSLLLARAEELDRSRSQLEPRRQALTQSRATLASLEESLRTLHYPTPEDVTAKGATESLRKAQRDVGLLRARLAHHQRREELLASLEEALVNHAALLSDVDRSAAEHAVLLVTVDALLALLRESGAPEGADIPKSLQSEDLAARLTNLRAERLDLALRLGERRAQLEQTRGNRVANRDLLKQLERELPRLEAVLAREEELASHGEGLRDLPAPRLLSEFSSILDEIGRAAGRVKEAEERLERAGSEVEAIQEQILNRIDPLVRQQQLKREELRAELRRLLEEGRPIGPPSLLRNETSRTTDEALVNGTGNPFESDVWIKRLEQNRTLIIGRITFFGDQAALRVQFEEVLQRRKAAWERLETTLSEQLKPSKKALNAARELLIRRGRNEIGARDLPERTGEMAATETVTALEERIAHADRESRILEERTEKVAIKRQTDETLKKGLEERLRLTDRKLSILRKRTALATSFEPSDPPSEIERTKLEHAAQSRIEQESAWFESFLAALAGGGTVELTELLKSYYRERIELERKLDNLADRELLTERLLSLVEEERALYENLEPTVRRRFNELRGEEIQARFRHRTRLAAGPAERDQLLGDGRARLEALRAELDFPLDTTITPPQPSTPETRTRDVERAADRIFDARTAVMAYDDWLDRIKKELGRLGLDLEAGALRDQNAILDASAREIRQRLGRLNGFTEADLSALPPEEKPRTELAREQFLLGDIGWARKQRVRAMARAAGRSIILLLVIPALALLLVKLANRVGRRLIAHYEEADEESGELSLDETQARKERRERARTLFTVFRAAWNILIFSLAVIYLLKAFHVDVTPLLASAGILGLAVAFGAQSLVKDFFAGFFILMENQYKLGDVITIGATTGTVEAITLRLTVLRDKEGIVHFIPNGQVATVSNRTKDWSRIAMDVGVAYKEEPDTVIACLKDVLTDLNADEEWGPKILEWSVPGVENFGDSQISIRVSIKVRPGEQWNLAREFRRRVKHTFDERGIEIPFPQRVIYHKYPDGRPADAPVESD